VSSGYWSIDGTRLRGTTVTTGDSNYQVSIEPAATQEAEPASYTIRLESYADIQTRPGGVQTHTDKYAGASNTHIKALVDNNSVTARIASFDNESVVHPQAEQHTTGATLWPHSLRFTYSGMTSTGSAINNSEGSLRAPMPGKVISVEVKADDTVEEGQTLMVIEAMKMEHAIVAPANGSVEEVCYAVGDTVDERATLVRLSDS